MHTDVKTVKMLILERMLPEYRAITIDNVMARIEELLYCAKLKQNATKSFLKWVEKQLEPTKQEIVRVFEQIQSLDFEHYNLTHSSQESRPHKMVYSKRHVANFNVYPSSHIRKLNKRIIRGKEVL